MTEEVKERRKKEKPGEKLRIAFGNYLKAERERQGYTQEVLARLCAMHQEEICRMEKGKQFPGSLKLLRLERVLGLNFSGVRTQGKPKLRGRNRNKKKFRRKKK